jgi:hypothetical protein
MVDDWEDRVSEDEAKASRAMDVWRWCDELTVMQAALLANGLDPGVEFCYVEGWDIDKRPGGYEAAKHAITRALKSGKISGEVIPKTNSDFNGNEYPLEGTVDVTSSIVDVESLKTWLEAERGVRPAFFFPAVESKTIPDYMNHKHSRYSPKLAAAVRVWQAMEDENLLRGKPVMSAMNDWMEMRYKELELIWKGEINKTAIAECAKIANWKTEGGATKTPE